MVSEYSYYQCPNSFCQCQTIGNPYSTQQPQTSTKIYVFTLFILTITIVCTKLGIQWFIYKDYFPLKQKSPILCIMLTVSIGTQMVIYPILYIYNFFTNMFLYRNTQLQFRSIDTGLQFAISIIYLIRCLRIYYAFNVHPTRRKTTIFRFFQRQYLLALCLGCLCLVKILIVIFDTVFLKEEYQQTKDFALLVELQTPINDLQHLWEEVAFIYRSFIFGFFWHCILCYCLWLHQNINKNYSMKIQLLVVIIANLIKFLFSVIQFSTTIDFKYDGTEPIKNILNFYCTSSYKDFYPNTELLQCIYLLIVLFVTIIKPLHQKKVCHTLLPTGKQQGFLKTMRDFLMQQQFLMIYTKYLQYLDQKNGEQQQKQQQQKISNNNQRLLQFWQDMVLIKFHHKQDNPYLKFQYLIAILQNLPNQLFVNQSYLIGVIKGQIQKLKTSSITYSSIQISQKQKQFVKQKIDQLEKIGLEKLDHIYVKQYTKTQSYQYLKGMTQNYKKINVNMIMLHLALIADPS